MTEDRTPFPAHASRPDSVEADNGPMDAATEARISAILSDPTLPESEKRLRLEDLLRQSGEDPSDGEDYAPVQTQLMHALALLADGGHDYGRREDPSPDDDVPEATGVEDAGNRSL